MASASYHAYLISEELEVIATASTVEPPNSTTCVAGWLEIFRGVQGLMSDEVMMKLPTGFAFGPDAAMRKVYVSPAVNRITASCVPCFPWLKPRESPPSR